MPKHKHQTAPETPATTNTPPPQNSRLAHWIAGAMLVAGWLLIAVLLGAVRWHR